MIVPLKAALRRIPLALRSLQRPDSSPERQFDVLLISPDANKSERTVTGDRFDRILDSLALDLVDRGVTAAHINRPLADALKPPTYNPSYFINRAFFSALISDWAMSLVSCKLVQSKRVDLFQQVFARFKPKAIFAIESRSYMWIAAERLQIPFFEVLHGFGYEDLAATPPFSRHETEGLPPNIVSFDRQSSDSWLRLGGEENSLFESNNVWLKHLMDHGEISPLEELLLPTKPDVGPSTVFVLVTMTWGEEQKKFESILMSAISNMDQSVSWMVRMHPVASQSRPGGTGKRYTKIEDAFKNQENVDLHESSQVPLPFLLRRATHHLTWNSMASYEAAEFGLRTLALSPDLGKTNPGSMKPLHDEGYVVFASEFDGSVEDWLAQPRQYKPRHARDYGVPFGELFQSILEAGRAG